MRNKVFVAILAGFFISVSSCFSYERVNPRGPLAVRNQLPIYLFYYFFPQESADVVGQGRFATAFDYTVSNVIVDKVTTPTEEYIIRMDMEINRLNLNLKYGVLENFEASLELPYIALSRGYLDAFVEEFEDFVGGTSVGARKRTDKNRFNYSIQHNNRYLINTQTPTDGIGDAVIGVKYMLVDEVEYIPRTSIRGAIKFPTASENKYLGSGKFDYGLGLLADKSFGRLLTYFNFNAVYIDKPDYLQELDIENYIFSYMAALEYCFTEYVSGILQATWNSTPYPDTGTDPMDNDALEIGLGLSYQAAKNSNWHIAVIENVYADSSPDVTFQVGGKIEF